MILTDAAMKTKYWVHFHHVVVAQDDPLFRLSSRKTQATIHEGPCKLKERPCGTPSFFGEAHCSRVDRFDHHTGRKQALLNAMIGPNPDTPRIPKQIRDRLWASYFEQRSRYEPYRSPHLKKNSKPKPESHPAP